MTIAIVPGSGKITKIQGAKGAVPTFATGRANFATVPAMHAEGEVHFTGAAGDDVTGWNVGWVQAQWIETNWGFYKGQNPADGSLFLQRGRAPARATQACRDTSGLVGTIFTDPTDPKEFQNLSGTFPQTVKVESNDPPGEAYVLIETNSVTGKPNFLQEVQLEFHFCTVLTVQDPAGNFHHQAHFYWNVHWQYTFLPSVFPAPTDLQWTPTARTGHLTNTHGVSRAFSGTPEDRRFTGVLTSVQSNSCVDLARVSSLAVETVGNASRREFNTWTEVDVRR